MPNLCIIPQRAVTDRTLLDSDVRLLCAIGTHTNPRGENCFAGAVLLSEEAGISRSTFFVAAKRLIEKGYVRKTRRKRPNGSDTSSVYDIILDQPEVGSDQPDSTPEKSGPPDPPRPSRLDPHNEIPLTASSSSPKPVVESDLMFRDHVILPWEYYAEWHQLSLLVQGSGGDINYYAAEMAMAVQGEHGYPKATPAQIGDAVRGFLANGAQPNFSLFKAYLRRAAKPRMTEDYLYVSSGRQEGKTLTKNARVAATALVQTLRDCRVKSTVGVSVGHLVLPANWASRFSDVEASVIKAVGTSKLLSDEEATASIALSDLANVIQSRAG
jgi:hypothetical protein